jgi:hypothetical protein
MRSFGVCCGTKFRQEAMLKSLSTVERNATQRCLIDDFALVPLNSDYIIIILRNSSQSIPAFAYLRGPKKVLSVELIDLGVSTAPLLRAEWGR